MGLIVSLEKGDFPFLNLHYRGTLKHSVYARQKYIQPFPHNFCCGCLIYTFSIVSNGYRKKKKNTVEWHACFGEGGAP